MPNGRYPEFKGLVADLGGIVFCSAASLSPQSSWLTSHLERVLGANGLAMQPTALDAYVAAALAMSRPPNACARAADAANTHAMNLSGVGIGTSLMRCVLAADIVVGGYDARTRESCLRMLSCMLLPPRVLYEVEMELSSKLNSGLIRDGVGADGSGLDEKETARVVQEDESIQRHTRGRWMKIGGATAISGVLLGVSGGMLAPAILPALSAAGLTAAGSAGASTALAAAFGTAGAGIGATAMRNRVGAVEEFKFERCVVVDGPTGSLARGTGDITLANPKLNITVASTGLAKDGGSLLVYAFELWQNFASVVPAGVRFGVMLEREGIGKEWAVAEEVFDAGGRDKTGKPKRQRYTGAVTVLERPHADARYVLQWSLLPGSLPTNISFRAAWVPTGTELPAWISIGKEEALDGGQPGFHRAPSSNRLSALTVSLFVPGLLQANQEANPGTMSEQFCAPGGVVDALRKTGTESFALVWETEVLAELSHALQSIGRNAAVSFAAQKTAIALSPVLMSAVALPVALVGAIRGVVDNAWARAMSRAVSAGIMLASEIVARGFGKRPISLSGYSLGALLAFTACEELARRNKDGLIHDVHFIGAPMTSTNMQRWDAVRKIVSGRLVNVYNRGDWYLEVMSKGTGNSTSRLAGRSPVLHAGVQNISLADIDVTVTSHGQYAERASEILVKIGVGNGEEKRDWPWAWTQKEESSLASMRLDLDDLEETGPGLKSSSSFEVPNSPPVVVFNNNSLKTRNRRGSRSQPPDRMPRKPPTLGNHTTGSPQ